MTRKPLDAALSRAARRRCTDKTRHDAPETTEVARTTIATDVRTQTRQRGAGEATAVSARAVLNARMSEADWQALVIDTANRAGWHVHHQIVPYRVVKGRHIALTEDGTEKGFPDLVLVHSVLQRVVFAELKRERGKTTPQQDNWLAALLYAGQEAFVWRPSDYLEVCRVLCMEEATDGTDEAANHG